MQQDIVVHEHDGVAMNKAWMLTEDPRFEKTILAVIILNTALLMVDLLVHGGDEAFEFVHHFILAVFILELVIKFVAVRCQLGPFFSKAWNLFDVLVIALSLLPFLGTGAMLLRMARLARLLHTARHVQHVRLLELLRR